MLKTWFWKPDVPEVKVLDVWQKTCQYLYLPRLRDESVFRTTLTVGAGSRDFFGLAYAKEGKKYQGFSFGTATIIALDSALLLLEPNSASAYAEAQRAAEEAAKPRSDFPIDHQDPGNGRSQEPETEKLDGVSKREITRSAPKRQFYGAIELDPIQAKKQFSDLVDEVVLQFTSPPGVKVKIAIEIQAESPAGFDDGLQRTVKENCNVLRFKNAEFEGGE